MNQHLEVLILANKNWKSVKKQFLADCKGNGIKVETLSEQKFRLPNTPKANTAIRLIKERLGMNQVRVEEVDLEEINWMAELKDRQSQGYIG